MNLILIVTYCIFLFYPYYHYHPISVSHFLSPSITVSPYKVVIIISASLQNLSQTQFFPFFHTMTLNIQSIADSFIAIVFKSLFLLIFFLLQIKFIDWILLLILDITKDAIESTTQ